MTILSVSAILRQTKRGIAGSRLFIENGKGDKFLDRPFRAAPVAATSRDPRVIVFDNPGRGFEHDRVCKSCKAIP
jgi:hypothetical protein